MNFAGPNGKDWTYLRSRSMKYTFSPSHVTNALHSALQTVPHLFLIILLDISFLHFKDEEIKT